MSRDSVRRAVRTFLITTLALFVPGLLGWLNELTQWAGSEGQRPFPDGTSLAYLGVSAIVAGVSGRSVAGLAVIKSPPRAARDRE